MVFRCLEDARKFEEQISHLVTFSDDSELEEYSHPTSMVQDDIVEERHIQSSTDATASSANSDQDSREDCDSHLLTYTNFPEGLPTYFSFTDTEDDEDRIDRYLHYDLQAKYDDIDHDSSEYDGSENEYYDALEDETRKIKISGRSSFNKSESSIDTTQTMSHNGSSGRLSSGGSDTSSAEAGFHASITADYGQYLCIFLGSG